MAAPVYLPRTGLGQLVEHLKSLGYAVIAPVVREGVVLPAQIESADQIAHGLSDEQGGGHYRLVPGDPDLSFEYVVGPDGPKRYLFPPRQTLMQLHTEGDRFVLDEGMPQVPKLALLGIRPCELAAIGVQDKVFGVGDQQTMRCESEVYYTQTRQQALTIVVDCVRPGGTCFCVSMGTGPAARDGFDLAMTELRDGFVVRIGSEKGREILAPLGLREAGGSELELAELKMSRACEHMGRALNTQGIKALLDQVVEHPHWDVVAQRCLSCGNCTMVCPTCFCSSVQDSADLSGTEASRVRQWASCYSHEFSYLTAGPVRHTIRGRYRHWLRHKLGTWFDQFGCSGCVGCGRCITWCPVGIDLTEEIVSLGGKAPATVQQAGNGANNGRGGG